MKPRIANMVDALTVYVRGRAQSEGLLSTSGGFSRDGKYTGAIRQATQLFVRTHATAEEDPVLVEVVSDVISSNVKRLLDTLRRDIDDNLIAYIAGCADNAWEVHKVWEEGSRRDNKIIAWAVFQGQMGVHGLSPADAYFVCVSLAKRLCPAVASGLSREIVFTPENQQAGIGILNYFSVILSQKLPNSNASVSIRQEKDRVILKITYPDGTGEEVSQLLTDYGLVVVGQKAAEDFLPDPIQAMALKQKLELAHLELRHTKEILALERSTNSARQSSLEEDVQFLKSQLAIQLQSNAQLTSSLVRHLEAGSGGSKLDPVIRDTLELLVNAVIGQDQTRVEEAARRLADASPDVFERLNRFITTNAIGGVIGNAAYAWLTPIWPVVVAAASR